MMYHLVHTYRNKSSWRSNPASERLGEGTESQGSRWHAAREELSTGRDRCGYSIDVKDSLEYFRCYQGSGTG